MLVKLHVIVRCGKCQLAGLFTMMAWAYGCKIAGAVGKEVPTGRHHFQSLDCLRRCLDRWCKLIRPTSYSNQWQWRMEPG